MGARTCVSQHLAVLGCYIAARLAPNQPLKHAMIWRYRRGPEHFRCCEYLERRAGIRTALVRARTYRKFASVRVDRREIGQQGKRVKHIADCRLPICGSVNALKSSLGSPNSTNGNQCFRLG